MGKDYYLILAIERNSDAAEIARAYRKLALKFHPKLTKEDINTAYKYFCNISEAYEVLSDPIKRAFYDKFGEEKLKEGFFTDKGNKILIFEDIKGGYRFGGNPEEIFEKFFGASNPFAHIFGVEDYGTLFSYAFGGQNFKGVEPPAILEVPVECTLNELYNGCVKKICYNRNVLNLDGRTTRETLESREIEIKPGYNTDSVIRFKGLGNETAGMETSDLVFKIKEVPHKNFRRKKNDLVYQANVCLVNALCADPITITHLDGRKLFVSIDEIINPKTIKQVIGEGMPIYTGALASNQEKGNLFIKFDISFPKSLTENTKQKLRDLFLENEEENMF